MKKITSIIYSPTGTSRKVAQAVAEGFAPQKVDVLDLTLVTGDQKPTTVAEGVAVIVVPVYAGRVAPEAVKRLQAVKPNAVPAVLVVVYGNRAFEDALVELKDLAVAAGFVPIAGAAFVGEHSYSTPEKPIAAGRPDAEDLMTARGFGISVAQLLPQTTTATANLLVSGNVPYKEFIGPSGVSPKVNAELCGLCRQCTEVCPVGAVTEVDGAIQIDASRCTMCCACVKACGNRAIQITAEKVLERIDLLFKNFQERKLPELFYLTKRPFEGLRLP